MSAEHIAHHCNGKTWREYPSAVCSYHPASTPNIEMSFTTIDEMWDFLNVENDIKCPVCENPEDGGPIAWMCKQHRNQGREVNMFVATLVTDELDKQLLEKLKRIENEKE